MLTHHVCIGVMHLYGLIFCFVCVLTGHKNSSHDEGLFAYFLIIRAVLFGYYLLMCQGILRRYCATGSSKRSISLQLRRESLLKMHGLHEYEDERAHPTLSEQDTTSEEPHYVPSQRYVS